MPEAAADGGARGPVAAQVEPAFLQPAGREPGEQAPLRKTPGAGSGAEEGCSYLEDEPVTTLDACFCVLACVLAFSTYGGCALDGQLKAE